MKKLTYSAMCMAFMICFVETAHAASGRTAQSGAVKASAPVCVASEDPVISNVDLEKVRVRWLQWYNVIRASRGLAPYIYDPQLNRTAEIWSAQAAAKGSITHSRTEKNTGYVYAAVRDWFAAQGLVFRNISGITFTENIGWGVFSCKSGNCTEKFISEIRSTFDFYVGEEHKKNASHWNSLISPTFTRIGLGVAVKNGKYYLTVHYGTAITSDPAPICL